MTIESFFSGDKGKDRVKIANAIRSGNISEKDIEKLLVKLKEREYFWESDFKKNSDRTVWTSDYANRLTLDCLLYFSEDYLRHLHEVSSYINRKKFVNFKNSKIFVFSAVIIFIFVIILFFLFK